MPFLLQPNEHRSGTLHPYTAGTEMYFYHHQSEYRPVEVAVRKVNEKSPNVVMYIATYPHPDKENHQWVDTTDADGRADITIEEGYPWYCTDCFYYVSVFFMDSEAEQDNTAIEIEYNCPDSVCKVCKNGFDPSTDCKECLPGFYGKDCKACKNCNHGTCDSGISGTGKCVCNEGWGPRGGLHLLPGGLLGRPVPEVPELPQPRQVQRRSEGRRHLHVRGQLGLARELRRLQGRLLRPLLRGSVPRHHQRRLRQ